MDGMAEERSGNSMDDVIALYRRGIDVTLLRENLRRTPLERLRRLEEMAAFVERHRGAARRVPPPTAPAPARS
jgi:hypothetical protein